MFKSVTWFVFFFPLNSEGFSVEMILEAGSLFFSRLCHNFVFLPMGGLWFSAGRSGCPVTAHGSRRDHVRRGTRLGRGGG